MNGEEDLNRKEMYKVVTSENREARLMKKLEKHHRFTGSTESTFEAFTQAKLSA